MVHGLLSGPAVKNPPAVLETWVQSLGRKDPLKKEMATPSSILVWGDPMDRGAWWLQSRDLKELDTTERLSIGPQAKEHSKRNNQ